MTASRSTALYLRISDDRAGSGLGVQRQEKECRALAERLGWDVRHIYVDNDVTATDRRKPRPQWLALLDALGRGQHSGLIAWHPDRLYRQTRDLLALIDLCDQGRVQIATVTAGDVDLSTPAGRAVAKTIAAWNEYEGEQKSLRIRAKYVQLAEAGQVGNGGNRPYGYATDRTTIIDAEAEELRAAYAAVLAGRSLRSIVTDWNARGVTTSTGRPWTQQALRLNLLSGRNAGLREHRRQVVGPAVWPPIVDQDTWDRVGAALRASGRLQGDWDGVRKYLLTGFLRCGVRDDATGEQRSGCGLHLTPVKTHGQQRFGCRHGQPGQRAGHVLVSYEPTAALVEALVLAKLERDVDLAPAADDDPVPPLLAAIDAERARLTALAEAFGDDPDGNPLELRAAGARIRSRIADLERDVARASSTARVADPVRVRQRWVAGEYDLAQKREVLRSLLERVDVAPAVRGRSAFDPDRIVPVWR